MVKTYSVKINDPYESNLEKFFHNNSYVFAKKPAEGGAHYMVEMNDMQKKKLLSKFKSVIVSLPEMMCRVDDEDLAFVHPEPDSPEENRLLTYAKILTIGLMIGFIVYLFV